ncbi:unnamed protein product [Amoebophrya sp. A25]|nr:unnamed protein product [Amoebophrya sp. A25]|eukprot:GSA25T00022403001.1
MEQVLDRRRTFPRVSEVLLRIRSIIGILVLEDKRKSNYSFTIMRTTSLLLMMLFSRHVGFCSETTTLEGRRSSILAKA